MSGVPYGGTYAKVRFGEKERDVEGATSASLGLDYFEARYLGVGLGRFTSPDPIPGAANLPQSWNEYAYVRNNPLRLVDPTGMQTESAGERGPLDGEKRCVNESACLYWDASMAQWSAKMPRVVGFLKELASEFVGTAKMAPGRELTLMMWGGLIAGKTDEEIDAALEPQSDEEHQGYIAAMVTTLFVGPFGSKITKGTQVHHIASKYRPALVKLLKRGGVDVESFFNKMGLASPPHLGPHPEAYHAWVQRRLEAALQGAATRAEMRFAIRKALLDLRRELLKNPKIVKGAGIP